LQGWKNCPNEMDSCKINDSRKGEFPDLLIVGFRDFGGWI
jgi:hypothetical protein